MRNVVWALTAGMYLGLATVVGAQAPRPQTLESQPADTMSRTPEDTARQSREVVPDAETPELKAGKERARGGNEVRGKDGDPIGATNDDKGRHGEAHSDPTLATKPAPPSDPKFQ